MAFLKFKLHTALCILTFFKFTFYVPIGFTIVPSVILSNFVAIAVTVGEIGDFYFF